MTDAALRRARGTFFRRRVAGPAAETTRRAAGIMTAPRDLWYMVSRFPVVSETFIVRELDAISVGTPRCPVAVAVPRAARGGPSDRAAVGSTEPPPRSSGDRGVVWACVRHPIRFLRARR